MHKLGVIVPYRDRPEQLEAFTHQLSKYLARKLQGDYTIIVVNQSDRKAFNRGKLLNIGFIEAKKKGCDYVVFHDVDMLPHKVDYSYSDKPLQMANNFIPAADGFTRTIQRNYFGGATLFNVEDFEKINGYSNKYKGWGFEDDDLLLRCRELGLTLENESYRTPSFNKRAIYFNGKDSYLKFHNVYRTVRPFSLVATFVPDPIECNPTEITDEFTLFSIPGHDMNITYNSFNRYKFELFLKDNTPISITSDYLPPLPTQLIVNVDPRKKRIQYFINGKEVGLKYWDGGRIRVYEDEPHFYLGCANPERDVKKNFFKGHLINFGILNGELGIEEVRKIFLENTNTPLNFALPELMDRWLGYWDSSSVIDSSKEFTAIDTSGYDNHGWGINCSTKEVNVPKVTRVKFPYRREGTHKLMSHEERGYTDGFWKDWSSRENQLRYYRLVNSNDSNYANDGLSTCKFRIKDIEENSNYTKLNVIT